MEMAVFYSKGGQYGAEPCFVSAKQSFETVVASSRSETLNIPCKPPNLHASCDAAGFLNPFAQRLLNFNGVRNSSALAKGTPQQMVAGNLVLVVRPLRVAKLTAKDNGLCSKPEQQAKQPLALDPKAPWVLATTAR